MPVDIAPSRFAEIQSKAIGARLVSADIVSQDSADVDISRAFIRHDGTAVSAQLSRLLA